MTAIAATEAVSPRQINTRRALIEGLIVGVVLTGLSYAVGAYAGWISNPDKWTAVEVFAVFTSYVCTYMCVKESRFNYPIGAVSTAAYCVLFFHYDLLASAVLNGYLALALVYGWFRWRSDENSRQVQHVALKWVPVYIGVTALFYIGALVAVDLAGGSLPRIDSIILVGTILAQFLLDNKKIETWMVWAVVNVAAIYTYFNADLNLAGFQYIFFLLNTVYGYVQWRKNLVPQHVEA